MQKLIKYLLIITLSVISYSCNDFLDNELKGEYTSDNFYTTAENATMSVTSIYNSLYGTTLWVFGDVASDDAVKGGNAGDQADINAINDFTANSDNGFLNTFWKSSYETIARANNAIAYIPDISMDEAIKNRLVGEAKFLRAYAFFNLVNIYGEIPLKLEPSNKSAAIHTKLSEVGDVYTQIENDLKDAADVLPVSYDMDKGRITKGAAHALLAKTYLFRKKYTDALTSINDLEMLNVYELEENYEDLFKVGAEDSKEVIFGFRYVDDELVSLGNNMNVWFAPSIEGGYYFNAPTQSFVDAFADKTVDGDVDPRLDASIGRDGQPWFNERVFSAAWSEATGYLVKKYNEDMVKGIAKSRSTIPYHAIRYADIILMKAEALNETESTENAIVEVNKIKNRANLPTIASASQVDLRRIIQVERRKELGFEFHRFFDLMRWGKSVAEDALGEDFAWTEPRFYFPLPQSELDTNQALQ